MAESELASPAPADVGALASIPEAPEEYDGSSETSVDSHDVDPDKMDTDDDDRSYQASEGPGTVRESPSHEYLYCYIPSFSAILLT